MSYFPRILNRSGIYRHDGRPMWDYHLTEREFQLLISEIKNSTRSSLDPRDCALYYAEWWKRMYNGGTPSKELIFKSINNGVWYSRLNAEDFYKLAKEGGYRLKYNWIHSTNTLYFRTLLLNGGLPLKHIKNNRTNYETFLSETLELQPNSVQDVFEAAHIHKYLPLSSQNEYIFSSCYDVVEALLSGSNKYDNVFNDDDVLGEILSNLKDVAKNVESRRNSVRSKHNWYISLIDGEAKLSFHIILNPKYSEEEFKELIQVGELTSTHYYLMVGDELAYKISKTQSGDFSSFVSKSTFQLNDLDSLPIISITGGEESKTLPHLLTSTPKLDQPSLWITQEEGIYRYSRTPFTSSTKANLLIPSSGTGNDFTLLNSTYHFREFEGEISLEFGNSNYRFQCGVDSFDWNINVYIPAHVQSSSEKIISNSLSIQVFDNGGNRIPNSEYDVYFKSRGSRDWISLENQYLPLGFIDIKIDYNGVDARDEVFNIGNLAFELKENSVSTSRFELLGMSQFLVEGVSNELTTAEVISNSVVFTNTNAEKYDFSGSIKVKLENQKYCKIKLAIPFNGIEFITPEKTLITDTSTFCFNKLQGYRLIASPDKKITVSLYNNLRKAIRIQKSSSHLFSLIGLNDDIKLLYELGDPMNSSNFVVAEFKSDGILQKTIYLRPTTGRISLDENKNINVDNHVEGIRYNALPTRIYHDNVEDIPLIPDDELVYTDSLSHFSEVLVIAESQDPNILLSPKRIRFTEPEEFDSDFEHYQNQLFNSELDSTAWKVLTGYFQYCIDFQLPFSSLDQIKVLRQAPEVAVVFLLKTLLNQENPMTFLTTHLKRIETDLGISLFTISAQTWMNAVMRVSEFLSQQYQNPFLTELSDLVSMYFDHHGLQSLKQYVVNGTTPNLINGVISNSDLSEVRSSLGTRVLKELPKDTFDCKSNYGIPVDHHKQISILIRAGITVAEELSSTNLNLFGNTSEQAAMRRNIQYCKQIAPKLFERVIIQTLNRI